MDIAIVQYIALRDIHKGIYPYGIVHIPTMHMYCTWHGWYIGIMASYGTDGMPYPGYPISGIPRSWIPRYLHPPVWYHGNDHNTLRIRMECIMLNTTYYG